jgi:hypothetical protein
LSSRKAPPVTTAAEKVRPYEHLSDGELNDLTARAADLRLRLAQANPGEIRETLVRYGCPKLVAARMVTNPMMLPHAARFHIDAADSLLGDPDAKARMTHVQEGWERLRKRVAPISASEALERGQVISH